MDEVVGVGADRADAHADAPCHERLRHERVEAAAGAVVLQGDHRLRRCRPCRRRRSRSNGLRVGWWSMRTPMPCAFSFSAASLRRLEHEAGRDEADVGALVDHGHALAHAGTGSPRRSGRRRPRSARCAGRQGPAVSTAARRTWRISSLQHGSMIVRRGTRRSRRPAPCRSGASRRPCP